MKQFPQGIFQTLDWLVKKVTNLIAGVNNSGADSYRVFTFLITQGINNFGDDPTIIVLKNTLGIDVDNLTKSRMDTGKYFIAFDYTPDLNKTAVFFSNYTKDFSQPNISYYTSNLNISVGWQSNALHIRTWLNGVLDDSCLNNCAIEIRVYN